VVLAGLLAAGLLGAALRGGSYGIVERAESFIAVWWAIGLAVVFGLLPRQRWSPTARVAVGALFALAAWTALGLV